MKSALLLLDLQNEMVDPAGKVGSHGLAAAAAAGNVVENAAAALAAARAAGIPVVHVRLGFKADYSDCVSVAPRIATLKANKAAIIGTWGNGGRGTDNRNSCVGRRRRRGVHGTHG